MKRSNPTLRADREIKQDGYRAYGAIEKHPGNVNPVFLKGHYPVKKGEKMITVQQGSIVQIVDRD